MALSQSSQAEAACFLAATALDPSSGRGMGKLGCSASGDGTSRGPASRTSSSAHAGALQSGRSCSSRSPADRAGTLRVRHEVLQDRASCRSIVRLRARGLTLALHRMGPHRRTGVHRARHRIRGSQSRRGRRLRSRLRAHGEPCRCHRNLGVLSRRLHNSPLPAFCSVSTSDSSSTPTARPTPPSPPSPGRTPYADSRSMPLSTVHRLTPSSPPTTHPRCRAR